MTQHRPRNVGIVVAVLVGALVGAGAVLAAVGPAAPGAAGDPSPVSPDSDTPDLSTPLSGETAAVEQFESRDAFVEYVAAGQRQRFGAYHVTMRGGGDGGRPVAVEQTAVATDAASGGDGGTAAPDRIARTNVQVAGLDEPDIVKTDGRYFYYAPENRRFYVEPRPDVGGDDPVTTAPPEKRIESNTHIIDASDPDAPAVVEEIDTTGRLLQTGDELVVFEHDSVTGYDVSDPENPTESWSHPLNGTLVTARERNGTLYLVTETSVHRGSPCPVEPLGSATSVPCTDIYRPGTQIPVDATYSAAAVDAASGRVADTVSFVGTADNTVVYMSHDGLYVTYTKSTGRLELIGTFLQEEFGPTPARVVDRIEEIQSYDISAQSKQREIRRAVQSWLASLPEDERQAVEADLEREFEAYVADRQRDLTRTGIVRVGLSADSLDVAASGTVPGEPLNQFSLDQHDGTLRIATTVPAAGGADSVNDLYTLAADTLERRGAVTGMGETERVYSVRYVDDTAYVVTFRRIDPFHVVDLSNPDDPAEVGKLELPGYSSYLHPVDESHVLGIGEEDGRVKTVLFDVSDPSDPTIDDSTVLDRSYSAVTETHHAFLMDRRHGVFVLPAGKESVVMDYTDGTLDVETTVETDDPATRARYVEDSLYVFAGDSVTVVDETTWQTETTLDLDR